MAVLGQFVYVLGGWNDTAGPYSNVYVTSLDQDPVLDEWVETTAPMPSRLQHHAVITHGDHLYVLGGDNGFGPNSSVSDQIWRATPNAQGDITEWVEAGQLPQPLTIHAVTTLEDQVYILGGTRTFAPDSQVLDAVYTAPISADGSLGEFQELSPFPTPIGWSTLDAVDRHLFAISGKVEFNPTQLTETIWAAEASPDHQLSPFEARGMTIPRERHTAVVLDRTLVVIAGGGDTGVLAAVEAAEVDPQGTLGPWMALSPLPEPRYAHAAFVYDNSIYVSGGFLRYGSNETSSQIFRLSIDE